MGDSSASYIHMVQHLIEKCLIFRMTKDECMEALSKHANIKPVITSTVFSYTNGNTVLSSLWRVREYSTRDQTREIEKWGNFVPRPHILNAVWNELEKENREFFESYSQSQPRYSSRADRMSEGETSELIQKMISDHQTADSSDGDDK